MKAKLLVIFPLDNLHQPRDAAPSGDNNYPGTSSMGPAIGLRQKSTTNIKIINNILYENNQKYPNDTQGVAFAGSGGGHVIQNNICYATTPGSTGCIENEGGRYTATDNLVNTLNPMLVNAPATIPSAPNFALTATSRAIGIGFNLSSILSTRTSYNGVTRLNNGTYDIGAYEY